MRIGFIGLGRMGSGLAGNLLKAGYDLAVYDINPQAQEALQVRGARGASTLLELACQVDVLFTSLPLPGDVTGVLLGETGCITVLPADATLIDVSTIDPQTARQLATAAEARGLHFLACPLGKGPAQAAEGTEPMFVGGSRDVFLRQQRLLEAIGHPVSYLGEVEQATAFKLISNLIGMTNVAVLAEGLALGAAYGLDLGHLLDLLAVTAADSYQLHLRGPLMLQGDYASRFSIDLTSKDLGLAVNMARARGIELPFGALAYTCFQQAQTQGLGGEDTAAIYKMMHPDE
jgi:3-hydroxyisobutyrate dehydrogenase-like beta-hydroxyacid dehydrogenase